MNKETIVGLEDIVFEIEEKPEVAAAMMADIIGVLIGLKPVMIRGFGVEGLKKSEYDKFEKKIDELNLKIVLFEHCYLEQDRKIKNEMFCISKKIEIARQAQKALVELWATMNDEGEIIKHEEWAESTKKIGELLGYPETAVVDFIKGGDLKDEERRKRMKRNRYFVHSAEHEEEEFMMYDKRLNGAISDFAPRTASCLASNKEKRWLV